MVSKIDDEMKMDVFAFTQVVRCHRTESDTCLCCIERPELHHLIDPIQIQQITPFQDQSTPAKGSVRWCDTMNTTDYLVNVSISVLHFFNLQKEILNVLYSL